MGKLAILVTTMYQTDISKFESMNLSTDAVIANQSDFEDFSETEKNGCRIRFVSKSERGLSRNRNTAIDNCFDDVEFIMFSDDDLLFYDDYEKTVLQEFKDHPKADAIKFNLNCVSKRKITMKPIASFHKATRREVTSFGVCVLAVKKTALKKSGIRFCEYFGAGTPNYCGEDSIFLQDMFKEGIKLYLSPKYIADIDQDNSSWYDGDLKKFSTVCGMIIDEIYPVISYPLCLRSAFKAYKRNDNIPFFSLVKWYLSGATKNKIEHIKGKRKI